MIRQEIYLDLYDWYVVVYYDYTCSFFDDVINEMKRIGSGKKTLRIASRNLHSCETNTGITFSDYEKRYSIVVISRTTSSKEFQKTYVHELGHLSKHIAKYYVIQLDGEEVEYIGQEVVDKTWNISKLYLCDCDCCKDSINKLNNKNYGDKFKNRSKE